jgi:hypothetical protein
MCRRRDQPAGRGQDAAADQRRDRPIKVRAERRGEYELKHDYAYGTVLCVPGMGPRALEVGPHVCRTVIAGGTVRADAGCGVACCPMAGCELVTKECTESTMVVVSGLCSGNHRSP